jgi:threonine/homoserine/homoserine lactone efflux protein
MINADTLLLFCATAFVLIITPGPNQIYIIARSTIQGKKAGLLSALGVDAGTLIHVVAASLGSFGTAGFISIGFQYSMD